MKVNLSCTDAEDYILVPMGAMTSVKQIFGKGRSKTYY